MEYIIRHGGLSEEVYLKSVAKDYQRNQNPENPEEPKRRGRKRKHEEERPSRDKGDMTATWTRDEKQALYFQSRKAAEDLIHEWKRVLRNAVIVEA